MAPRTFKGKNPAKATLVAAAAAAASLSPAERTELGDEFHEAYNNLLVTKMELIETIPGSARKRLTTQMGEELVSASYRHEARSSSNKTPCSC
jgi:hypothetical protein